MSSQEDNPPLHDERVRFVQERLQSNPQQFLNEMEAMSNELAQLRAAAKTPSPSASDPPVSTLNPALAPSLDPQIAALMKLLLARNPEPRSEKLPDISGIRRGRSSTGRLGTKPHSANAYKQ